MPQHTHVTAAEISRLAGVTRATVSNWRRRHPDFPSPSGGTEVSPAYDLAAVRAWLATRGQLPASSPADDLRTALRTAAADSTVRTRLLPLVLTAGRLAEAELARLAELPEDRLPAQARQATLPHADDVPGGDRPAYGAQEAPLLRAVLRSVVEEGALRTLDVLAEGGLDESAAGTYETPAPLAKLMADLLAELGKPYPERVFDPACGTGALLTAAAGRGARELSGQDVVVPLAARAAVQLALTAGSATTRLRAGDSLRADAFPALAADAVLCVPPYGQRDWGHEELAYDPRWTFGLPAKGEPELAWLQHCLAHLAPGGRAVLLMPPSSAVRLAGRRIRAEMLRSGVLRAVVALPPGVAQPLHIGLHLWLLHRPHPQTTAPPTILLMDTATPHSRRAGGGSGSRATPDWAALRRAVLDAWTDFDRYPHAFDPVPGVMRAVAVVDLLDDAVDFTPARHMRGAPIAVKPEEFAEAAEQLRGRMRRAATGLLTVSGAEGLSPVGAVPLTWRTATVADLLRGGALTLMRAPAGPRGSAKSGAPAGGSDPDGLASGEPRTLTVRDVVSRRPASGSVEENPLDDAVTIQVGDVILPEILHAGASAVRVTDIADAGHQLGPHLFLLRPDRARLDPWFLSGFLAAEDNLSAASSGTSVVRVDPRRLRVPLLPIDAQRSYGKVFRRLHALRVAADLANRLADENARTLAAGLTAGALLPPDTTAEGMS